MPEISTGNRTRRNNDLVIRLSLLLDLDETGQPMYPMDLGLAASPVCHFTDGHNFVTVTSVFDPAQSDLTGHYHKHKQKYAESIMGFLSGKRALIVGVAGERSIARGIAKAMHREGAELAYTYQNDKLKERVEKVASQTGSQVVLPCDVSSDDA
jgi:hypothetical protein